MSREVWGVPWSPLCSGAPRQLGREGTAERPSFCLGKKAAPSPPLLSLRPIRPTTPLSQELPRFSYFILQCPIQKSFQRPQPCQSGARTKGPFDFLFVFICQRRGRGRERKGCWVLRFLFGLLHPQRGWLPGTPFWAGGSEAGGTLARRGWEREVRAAPASTGRRCMWWWWWGVKI